MNLHDPGSLSAFLNRHGISAQKGLGQHFLCSGAAVESIVAAVAGCEGICEIGPGPGVLTSPIAASGKRVVALELDPRMVQALSESAPGADVRKLDALRADLPSILRELPAPRAVVSNLPYYITGPLLERIADTRSEFDRAVLMMQREVAERILAKPGDGDRGAMSVVLQRQFDISLVAHVAAIDFFPPPKVDSTVLCFIPRLPVADPGFEHGVKRLVRLGFAQPRKTLANNLAAGLGIGRDLALTAIEHAGLEEKVRPHELTEAHWFILCHVLLGSAE